MVEIEEIESLFIMPVEKALDEIFAALAQRKYHFFYPLNGLALLYAPESGERDTYVFQTHLNYHINNLLERKQNDDGQAAYLLGYLAYAGVGLKQDDKQAHYLFDFAASHACPEGLHALGFCYEHGIGVQQNMSKARQYYRQAIAKNCASAMVNLALSYQDRSAKDANLDVTIALYEKACQAENDRAFYCLANLYQYGKNLGKAINLYQSAANQGNPLALNKLAYFYTIGHGVARDNQQAIRLYQLAAKLGNASAMKTLASAYRTGTDELSQDIDQAIRLYEKAAGLNHIPAIRTLAELYTEADLVSKDLKRAFDYYKLAAKLGDPKAMQTLGDLYRQGMGCEKNLEKAIAYYHKAIHMGQKTLALWLATVYDEGKIVKKDPCQVIYLLEAFLSLEGTHAEVHVEEAKALLATTLHKIKEKHALTLLNLIWPRLLSPGTLTMGTTRFLRQYCRTEIIRRLTNASNRTSKDRALLRQLADADPDWPIHHIIKDEANPDQSSQSLQEILQQHLEQMRRFRLTFFMASKRADSPTSQLPLEVNLRIMLYASQ